MSVGFRRRRSCSASKIVFFVISCLPFTSCFVVPLATPASLGSQCKLRRSYGTLSSFRKDVGAPLSKARPAIDFSTYRIPLFPSKASESTEAAAEENKNEGKSVLVLSWFYAQPKEIELVKRIYKKRGYSTVIVVESLVKDAATPRGWYKSFLRFVSRLPPLPPSSPQQGRDSRSLGDLTSSHCVLSTMQNLFPHTVSDLHSVSPHAPIALQSSLIVRAALPSLPPRAADTCGAPPPPTTTPPRSTPPSLAASTPSTACADLRAMHNSYPGTFEGRARARPLAHTTYAHTHTHTYNHERARKTCVK